MRSATVITLFPDEEQTTLSFTPSSSLRRDIPHKDRQKRVKSVTRSPSTTTAPATGLPTPLSPKRQQQRRRRLLCSSPSLSSSTPHTADPNVISLLSDSSGSDVEIVESRPAKANSARPDSAIARWLGNPPAAPSSSGASQSRATGGIPGPSPATSLSKTNSIKSIGAPGEVGPESTEDTDQLVWSDEDGSAVPAHITRARKSKAARENRKQQRTHSSSSSRPKKRRRPLKATGRTPAPAQDEASVPAASTPLTSRWRHA